MELRGTSFQNNVTTNGHSNSDWGIELGQTDSKYLDVSGFSEIAPALLYYKIDDVANVQASFGSNIQNRVMLSINSVQGQEVVCAALFDNIYVNDKRLDNQKLIMFIFKKTSGENLNRCNLKWNKDAVYNGIPYNENCINAISSSLGCTQDGSWIVTDMNMVPPVKGARNDEDKKPKLCLTAMVVKKRTSFDYSSENERTKAISTFREKLLGTKNTNSIAGCTFVKKYDQIIRYGAPGTGKSYSNIDKERAKTITFHPETDYSSFVGCYKPTMDRKNKNIIYTFCAQPFIEAYINAWNDPTHEYSLVIEEINRGNCASIFGDLFQLLDRDEDGYSRYPIDVDDDLWNYLRDNLPFDYVLCGLNPHYQATDPTFEGTGKMALPPNLSIYATMNTSDQSLYKMDSAFKRRWEWEYVPIRYKAQRKTEVGHENEPIESDKSLFMLESVKLRISDNYELGWLDALEKINKFIKYVNNSTSKQMGQWFLVPKKNNVGGFSDIDFKQFRNKIIFYLFNDVFNKSMALAKPFEDICDTDRSIPLFEDVCAQTDDGEAVCKKFIQYVVDEDYKSE